jgi:hypothetical protein
MLVPLRQEISNKPPVGASLSLAPNPISSAGAKQKKSAGARGSCRDVYFMGIVHQPNLAESKEVEVAAYRFPM